MKLHLRIAFIHQTNKITNLMIPQWLQAGLYGLLAGSALIIGAGIGYYLNLPRRLLWLTHFY